MAAQVWWLAATRREHHVGARNSTTVTGRYHAVVTDRELALYHSTRFVDHPVVALCGRPWRHVEGYELRTSPPVRGPLGGRVDVCPRCQAASEEVVPAG